MQRKRSTKGTTYDAVAHERLRADIRRRETCEGCGAYYPGASDGNGPRVYGIGDGKPGGRWIYDCCNPDWHDDEIKGENDEYTTCFYANRTR